ncbi:MAG: tyrosine-type recombinase/integrase, partial [Patescibacteria group bacterium]
GWHTLRHTFAADLVAAGVPLTSVQKLLGHASITTTMRYVHLAPSALRGAIDTLEEFHRHRRHPESGQPVGNAAAQLSPLVQLVA